MCFAGKQKKEKTVAAKPTTRTPQPAPPPPKVMKAPPLMPTIPDRGPVDFGEKKEKATIKAKKVQKKKLALGTSKLKVRKPIAGGVNPTPVASGGPVNTGGVGP
jgi:hypothetical protein